MARKCSVCGKGISVGMNVSHSHIRTKRTWMPNLQRVKAIIDGSPQRVLVCTRCMRSGKVKRAI
ncbi:MAG: 50S ribosomal protein L28 [Desulfotomaculaceae bacterium]|nr:50S ribosomal protein L28 [Desulfotomaculaceae bacterium]